MEPERFPPFCSSFSDAVVMLEIRNLDALLEERPEVCSMITKRPDLTVVSVTAINISAFLSDCIYQVR